MNTHYTCKMTCLQRHPWITRMYFFINLPWEKFITDLLSRNLRRWKRKVFFPECDFLNQCFIKNLKKWKSCKKVFFWDKRDDSEKIEFFWWPEICFDATKMFFWSAIFFFCTKIDVNKFFLDEQTDNQDLIGPDKANFRDRFRKPEPEPKPGRDKNLWMRLRSSRVTSFPEFAWRSKILRTHSQKFPHGTRGTRSASDLRRIRQTRTWLHRNRNRKQSG